MPKVMVEVEIPEGWDYVATRCPRAGEQYINPYKNDRVETSCCDWTGAGTRIIVRPAWTWPAWLKAPWIAMDEGDPTWRAFLSEPSVNRHSGTWWKAESIGITPDLFDFTPPPCDDWRQSKRKNPNL